MQRISKMAGQKTVSGDLVFRVINGVLLGLVALIVLYPLYFVTIASISSPEAVLAGKVVLYPVDIHFDGFQKILERGDLEPFLESLPMDQQAALYRRYWLDLPLNQTERKAHDIALKTLRHPRNTIRLRALL